MARFLARRARLCTKLEATEGVDAMASPGTPDADTDVLIKNLTIEIAGDDEERDVITDDLDRLGSTPGQRWLRATFETEYRGMAAIPTAVSPLRIHPLLVSTGRAVTYSAGTHALYKYDSAICSAAANATSTNYFYLHNLLFIATGCRASRRLRGEVGRAVVEAWTVEGRYVLLPAGATAGGIRDAAIGSASFQALATKPPPLLSASFTTHSFAAKIRSFEFDDGNEIDPGDDITNEHGIQDLIIGARNPRGSFDPEFEARATHDFIRLWQEATEGVITLTVGTVSGNKMELKWPTAQYGRPSPDVRRVRRVFRLPFMANRGATADSSMEEKWL